MGGTGSLDEKLAVRFWGKVIKSDGCWLWFGSRNEQGYGNFRIGGRKLGRTVLAHRVAWELSGKPIPEGLCVLHRCDNPPCVNPQHLFLGTQQDNAIDREQKRRGVRFVKPECLVRGESHPRCKWTDDQINHMRSLAAAGNPYKDIRELFGISPAHLRNIVIGARRSGRIWRPLES